MDNYQREIIGSQKVCPQSNAIKLLQVKGFYRIFHALNLQSEQERPGQFQYLQLSLMGAAILKNLASNGLKKKSKILMIGFSGSGKSSIVSTLKNGKFLAQEPTLTFSIQQVGIDGYMMEIWDIGGRLQAYLTWHHYYHGTDALIYVSEFRSQQNAGAQTKEALNLLNQVRSHEHLKQVPVLVFLNKSQNYLQNKKMKIIQSFREASDEARPWKVQECSAKTGQGLREGMLWLAEHLQHQ